MATDKNREIHELPSRIDANIQRVRHLLPAETFLKRLRRSLIFIADLCRLESHKNRSAPHGRHLIRDGFYVAPDSLVVGRTSVMAQQSTG